MNTNRLLSNTRVIALLVLLLAGTSALIDFTTNALLSGEFPVPNYFRWLASKLLSCGTLWAGLAFYAGYRFAGPGWRAHVVGPLAGTATLLAILVAHYSIKVAFGIEESAIWAANSFWFIAAVVFGPLLGWVGAQATRRDLLGHLAKFVLPLGAIAEPFVRGTFHYSPEGNYPWPEQFASYTSGAIIIGAGVLGFFWAVRSFWRGYGEGPRPAGRTDRG